ncbi:hypothetical protein [Sulfuricurvum sp.]|uniref:hypothetical protein n=1 Tax=Sulfuricurvum sp. TaxID=2025608 RepID=UPI003BB08085
MINKVTMGTIFLLLATLISASEEVSIFSGKKIAIKYEDGKSPKDYYDQVFEISKQFVVSGDILSSEITQEGEHAGLIKVLVKTDSLKEAMDERNLLTDYIGERFADQNPKITTKLASFPENRFFGDKRIGYIINKHESCFYEDFLTKALKQNGAEIVSASQNPDIIMTVGVDTCLTNWELNKYLASKMPYGISLSGINKAAGIPSEIQRPSAQATIDNDLMRAGSSTNIALGGHDNVGLALMGIGAAVSILDKFSSGKAADSDLVIELGKEIDLVRYHIILEGRDKESVSFYSTYTGTAQHEKYSPIAGGAFVYPMKMLYRHMLNWANDSKVMKDSLLAYQKEPVLYKSLNMLIMGKEYKDDTVVSTSLSSDTNLTTSKSVKLASKKKQKIKNK